MSAAISGRGLYGAANMAPMRQAPPAMVRPPSLSGAPPAVASTTTFVAAGVQGVGRDADNACFSVVCWTGNAPLAVGATGTVTVALVGNARLPAAYFAAASWASITLSGTAAALAVNWTATETLTANTRYALQVEWLTST